ncbi:immunoglobulin superfamily member 3-like [Rhinophrynus dorsalis]
MDPFKSSCVTSIAGQSYAQREVIVQQGLLYRTEGTHISIWCKVRGYQGPAQQNFEWSVYQPSDPDKEVQVVSTKDSAFSYAIYSQRVRSGDIYIERVEGDHVLLHIRQLQERDTGEYECHTPNTDPTYHGSYSAKMNLIVIQDTLEVQMTQQDLKKTEGSPLELTCHVSKATSQHTHLSVKWLLTSEKDPEIITLTRDFVLLPGPNYSERFFSGDLRMDKLSDTSYRLTINHLQVSDQGEISCCGTEWIQDPAGDWTAITQKESEKTKVMVQTVKGNDFEVQIQAADTPLSPGSPLEIRCSIITGETSGRLFHVRWLLDTILLVTLSPYGIPSYGKKYGAQENLGHLAVGRLSQETWSLHIGQARLEDGGSYVCEISEEERGMPGAMKSRMSSPVSVTVKERASSLSVSLIARSPQVVIGNSQTLHCKVSADYKLSDRPLTWTWSFRPSTDPHGQYQKLVQLSHDGSLAWGDSLPSFQGKVQLSEANSWVDSTPHVLDLSREQDQMTITCHVQARSPGATLSLAWFFSPHSATSPLEIIRLSQDGVLSRSPAFTSKSVSEWVSTDTYLLRILRPDHGQQGSFHCVVTEWLQDEDRNWIRLGEKRSGETRVTFSLEVKTLNIPKRNMSVKIMEDEELMLHCPLGDVPSSASLYTVSWYYQENGLQQPQLLYLTSWDGVTKYNGSLAKRLHLLATSRENRTLILQRVGQEDAGVYHCRAEEWRPGAGAGEWRMESSDWSGYLKVTVTSPGLNSSLRDNLDHNEEQGDNLNLNLTELTILVPEGKQNISLPCQVVSPSRASSMFSVSWWRTSSTGGAERLLFRVSRDGHFIYPTEEETGGGHLQFERPSRLSFQLTILQPGVLDSGMYHCRVQEWVQSPRGAWCLRDYCVRRRRKDGVSLQRRSKGGLWSSVKTDGDSRERQH